LKTIERVNVLGVGVSVLNLAAACQAIAEAVERKRKGYVCVTGVHGVTEAQDDPGFRHILNNAFLCTPDGMPMVWVGKLRGFRQMGRVYGPDLMLELCRWSQSHPCRHFLFGGGPGIAEELKGRLETRFPGVNIAGCFTPPFRELNPTEELELRQAVQQAKPDVMWIGLSTPKQEKFMARYLADLEVTVMIGVGAAFDFHSGRVKQAPGWMQRSGLEWLYRLYREPRRLWRRYFRNNPLFIGRILCQFAGVKQYQLE